MNYVLVPTKERKKAAPLESLESLRRAVSKAWKGKSAVEEIRVQRKRA